jgi:hypothetical protein
MLGDELEINQNLSPIILQETGYDLNNREIYKFSKYYRNIYIKVYML